MSFSSTLSPIRLGILVPSSNTALEPLTSSILSSPPNVTVHFSRFPVTQIALSKDALAQFDDSAIIAAAQLLADAKVDMIGWSGTSAGWLGLEVDKRLCERIESETGIRATTSVIGLCRILDGLKGKKQSRMQFGMVTPYLDDVQAKIIETFGAEGYDIVAESHLNRSVNVEFASIGENILDRQVDEVVNGMGKRYAGQVVSTFCTNLRAAQRVAFWEEKYPMLIVLDTVATVLWDMLRMLDADTRDIVGWGRIFEIERFFD